jgi:hypothetical protein
MIILTAYRFSMVLDDDSKLADGVAYYILWYQIAEYVMELQNTNLWFLYISLHPVTERVLETVVVDNSFHLQEFCCPHQTELHGMKFLQESNCFTCFLNSIFS